MLNEIEKKEFERVCSAVAFVQIQQSKKCFKQQEVKTTMGHKNHTFRNPHVELNVIRVWEPVEENPLTSYADGVVLPKYSQKMKG